MSKITVGFNCQIFQKTFSRVWRILFYFIEKLFDLEIVKCNIYPAVWQFFSHFLTNGYSRGKNVRQTLGKAAVLHMSERRAYQACATPEIVWESFLNLSYVLYLCNRVRYSHLVYSYRLPRLRATVLWQYLRYMHFDTVTIQHYKLLVTTPTAVSRNPKIWWLTFNDQSTIFLSIRYSL